MTQIEHAEAEIRERVARETRAWDTKDAALLVSLFHRDMVWPWPAAGSADPLTWITGFGRYDAERWRKAWQGLFDSWTLVHNRRVVQKVVVSPEADGGFAVVDIDTLWRDASGREEHWHGRTCKVYTKLADDWKLIAHVGVLELPLH